MIIILGLVVLIAAVVIGVAGVLGNDGSAHALAHPFAVFGYHVTGSTGTLFLYGIVVGAIGLAGLGLLLAGARRTVRRGTAARRGLRQSRKETAAVSRDRDDLIDQREAARTSAAATLAAATPGETMPRRDLDPGPGPDGSHGGKARLFGGRTAPLPAAAGSSERLNGQAAPEAPADTTAP